MNPEYCIISHKTPCSSSVNIASRYCRIEYFDPLVSVTQLHENWQFLDFVFMSHPTRPNSRLLSDKQHLQQLLSSPISKPPPLPPPLQSSPSPLLPNHQPAAIAPSLSLPLPSSPEGVVSGGVSAPGAKADESKTTSSSNAPPTPSSSGSGGGGDKKINNNTTSYVSGGGRLKFFKGKTTDRTGLDSRTQAG